MALSQAAALVERLVGHGDNAVTEQDITNQHGTAPNMQTQVERQ